jgi:hypothetical protein
VFNLIFLNINIYFLNITYFLFQFADATPELRSEDQRREGESEKNRDCPETEVVIVTTTSVSEATSDLVKESSAVPEPSTTNGELLEPALLVTTNGHNGNGESTSDSDHVDEEKSKSPKKLDSTDISSSSSSGSKTETKAEETT